MVGKFRVFFRTSYDQKIIPMSFIAKKHEVLSQNIDLIGVLFEITVDSIVAQYFLTKK
jgi:hypothetical protein